MNDKNTDTKSAVNFTADLHSDPSKSSSLSHLVLTDVDSSDESGPSSPTSSTNSEYSSASSDLFNYYCPTCMLSFPNEKDYRMHYKSDLHLYNVKRGLVGLKPVTIEEFEKRNSSLF